MNNRIAPIVALTCSLLTGSVALAAEREPTAAAPTTVSWGVVKTASTDFPRTVALEMSPSGTVSAPETDGDRIHAAYYAGYVGSQVFDLATTGMALGKGALELNPVMRLAGAAGPGGLLVKALTTWGVSQMVKKLSRRDAKVAAATMTVMTAMNTAASLNNLANASALR